MISLKKNEILECLQKVSFVIEGMCTYPDRKISCFLSYVNDVDLRVYMFISRLRYLSFYEDAFLDSIDNDDIDLSDLRERIFVDKGTKNRFSNKQIIRFIRNAFFHSDNDKELYHISKNGRYLEVYLKKVKPCEFHVRMNYDDLDELVNRAITVNFYLSRFEDNKLKRFYLKDKISTDDFLGICNYLIGKKSMDDSDYSKAVLDYYKDNGKLYDVYEYSIMNEQIADVNKFNDLINKQISQFNIDNNTNKMRLIETFRSYQLSKIIPLQEEKLALKDDYIFFIELFYEYSNYSFHQLEMEFQNTGYKVLNSDYLTPLQMSIYFHVGNNFSRLFLFNGRDLVMDSYMEYISYYIMNI